MSIWIWLGFILFIITALSIDAFLLGKKVPHPHKSVRVAACWVGVWVSCAIIFNIILWLYLYNTVDIATANKKSLEFFTGYLIEESLAIDNLFVFFLIFNHFRIPPKYQQRVLSYGIWGAIVMRLIVILLGVWLISKFHWLLYLMGVVLLLTGVKIFLSKENEKDLSETWLFRLIQRYVRVTHELHNEHFFVIKNGLRYATPLFVALIFIEISDLVFAFDSIPAIFAITTDPFIVWTSNIFAILGLRAMYFMLSGVAARFRLLKYGIALILMFVGFKMVIAPWLHIPVALSLGVVASILLLFTVISIYHTPETGK